MASLGKEVIVGGDSVARRRFVIVRNPEEAERDRKKRESILTELRRHVTASGEVWQVRPINEEQKALFRALKVDLPPAYLRIIPSSRKGM